MSNQPSLFDGQYNGLTNNPSITQNRNQVAEGYNGNLTVHIQISDDGTPHNPSPFNMTPLLGPSQTQPQ